MIRLMALGYWHITRLAFRFLMRFDWMQSYMARAADMLMMALKLWLWWIGFLLVAWLLWDLLPLVAIAFMAYHIYRWRHDETW